MKKNYEDLGVGKLTSSDGRIATYEEVVNEVLDYGVLEIKEVSNTLLTDSISLTNNYYITGSGSNNLTQFLKATELLNIQNIFNSSKLKFYWGETTYIPTPLVKGEKYVNKFTYSINYLDENEDFFSRLKCYNLVIDIPNFSIIEGKNPVLLIDRYRKRARKGFKKDENGDPTDTVRYRQSGFKHYKNDVIDDSNFVTEIPITDKKMILGINNFNPDKLFILDKFFQNGLYRPWFRTSGSGKKVGDNGVNPLNLPLEKSGNVCSVKLRFRIGWKHNNKIFKTSDSGQIIVTINRETGNISGENFILTYKMI